MSNIYKEIYKEIKKADKILITTHIRADGDCVGSAIGLREMIKMTFPGKSVKALHENCDYLEFLGKGETATDDEFKDSLVISVDNASLKRANDKRLETASRIIKIDHHPNNEPFGFINLVEEEKCACAEMIFDLFLNCKFKLNKLGIEALFTGIVTDSGRFKYSAVTGETLKKVGIMYDCGLDAETILNRLDEVSIEEIKFKGWVYENVHSTEHGVLYVKIKPEDRTRFNVEYDEASNMVNALGNIEGHPIWILINEYKADEIRCRVRSIGIAINGVAQEYGGGGHANASGIVVHDYDTVYKILESLDKLLIKE